MKEKLLLVLLFLLPAHMKAYNYGEHKEIGDQAFLHLLDALQSRPGNDGLFVRYLELKQDSHGNYGFASTATAETLISYGVLNAISGDHESNPLVLEEQLRNRSSILNRIVMLHNQYLAMGLSAAPDTKLTRLDMHYALLAAVNLSHFYEYNKTFEQQLRHFDKKMIRQCENPSLAETLFRKLGKTNALNMYVTLHCLAIDLAAQSGRLARQQRDKEAQKNLAYAILFNGFADHFLEDCFSSGHLVVNRSIIASFTNNKALHDFYCEQGCKVVNSKGELWYAYGDGQFNYTHKDWQKDTTLGAISYSKYTSEAARIIQAVYYSLEDLSNAFYSAYGQTESRPFIMSIPDSKKERTDFFLKNFKALQLVPVPFSAQPAFPGGFATVTDTMNKTTSLPPFRNFIRSRVANSFVLSNYSPTFAGNNIKGAEFRVNVGNFSRRFDYNDHGTKKGRLDYWHGYTLSYSFAETRYEGESVLKKRSQLIKAGIRSNYDFWISNKRFIGLYSYLETGLQFAGSKAFFILMPSAGIQLASLFNINYYNMPLWLRFPVQYLLPLKLRVCMLIAQDDHPRYFATVDMDILF